MVLPRGGQRLRPVAATPGRNMVTGNNLEVSDSFPNVLK
jgi:hypothetical protein